MKVSVQILTYNQRKFIATAINSVLQQEVDFDYEIVIGDDCSSDGTQEILREFADANARRVRLLLHDQKPVGLPGKENFISSLRACRGEYVAMLDGDDYWTDPLKLSKQVQFLDANPDFAIASHNVLSCYEDGRQPEVFLPPEQPEVLTIENLFFRNTIHSCSAVFRNRLFESFPDWFSEILTGDWATHILNARSGKIRYFNEVMASYRVHDNAFWSRRPRWEQIRDAINMLGHFRTELGPDYEKTIDVALGHWYKELAWAHYEVDQRREARQALARYFSICESNPRSKQLLTFVRDEAPGVYKLLRGLKRTFPRNSI